MRKLSLALLLLLIPVVVGAQTPSTPADTPFRVQADHDGIRTDEYRVYIDGTKFGPSYPKTALVAGVVDLLVTPGVAAGPHTVQVAAFEMSSSKEARSAVLAFNSVSAGPNAPTNLRVTAVITIGSNGEVGLKLENVAVLKVPSTPTGVKITGDPDPR